MMIEDEYAKQLKKRISATQRGVKLTGYEHHKGAEKAYRDALKIYQRLNPAKGCGHAEHLHDNLE